LNSTVTPVRVAGRMAVAELKVCTLPLCSIRAGARAGPDVAQPSAYREVPRRVCISVMRRRETSRVPSAAAPPLAWTMSHSAMSAAVDTTPPAPATRSPGAARAIGWPYATT
jgi:hypothetical protein